MESRRENAAQHANACARVATQFRPPWLRSYVRNKLRSDRIYPEAYDLLGRSAEPILDVGCGMGLLAFYLRERACAQPILGLDLDARKIGCGAEIATRAYRDVELRFQDVERALPDFRGNIALFDVLHYLPQRGQTALLTRLAERVAPGGFFLIRDSLREMRPRYWMTWLAEKFAQTISWNIDIALHFPSRATIDDIFDSREFERASRPLWGASPFNNHIFIFRRRAVAGSRDPGRENVASGPGSPIPATTQLVAAVNAPDSGARNGNLSRSVQSASAPGIAD